MFYVSRSTVMNYDIHNLLFYIFFLVGFLEIDDVIIRAGDACCIIVLSSYLSSEEPSISL